MGRENSMLQRNGDVSVGLADQNAPAPEELTDGRALSSRDRGRAAWTCLTAISVISMVTWGMIPYN